MLDKNQISPGKLKLSDPKVSDNGNVRLGDATVTGKFEPQPARR